ncbi:hypothetical protein D3C78_1594910 [compost metagenome]
MQLVDLDGERFRLQAITGAGRAGGRRHVAFDFLTRPGAVGLFPATLQIGHDAFEILHRLVGAGAVLVVEFDLFLGALQDGVLCVLRKVRPFAREFETEGLAECFQRLVVIGRG